MGSGERVQFWVIPGFGLCLTVARFPFAVTVTATVACFCLSVGMGKGYDE